MADHSAVPSGLVQFEFFPALKRRAILRMSRRNTALAGFPKRLGPSRQFSCQSFLSKGQPRKTGSLNRYNAKTRWKIASKGCFGWSLFS